MADTKAGTKLRTLRADLALNVEQLGVIEDAATRTALENLWAWNESFVDTVDDVIFGELESIAEAVDELIDQNENVLHPELTAKIVGIFETGKLLCQTLLELVADLELNDMARKRINLLVESYRKGAALVTEELREYTVDLDELEPSDDEEGDDEGDEDQEEDGEPTEPTRPAKPKRHIAEPVPEPEPTGQTLNPEDLVDDEEEATS